ncbi:MAG TPA: ABC transporter permease subunit [Kouleothrix sp.]|uniref:ABC transporter permease n=1 Tax=Kouleothrix sp. TaxID=2779161 RepID=UPI002CA83D3D|nr:ABC transporter permease subunit [Kouleothrix sp.]
MHAIRTITWLTFREAWRRRMVLAALVLGLLFLLLFGIGFSLINSNMREHGTSALQLRFSYNLLMVAGLYVVHFLTVMLAIFASVDTIAGEIASHTIQAIVTKPVGRWQVVLGKWCGYAAMLMLYLALLSGGIVGTVYLLVGYLPPNPAAVLLLLLEALVLLSLSLLGGIYFSTLTNGVVLFMLYGVAFIGAWVEQIGALMQSHAAVNIGIITSLLMPVEALWRRAAYLMQPTVLNSMPSPFGGTSPPSQAMVLYAAGYAALALGLALLSFRQRDL